ncbi:Uncharacterised protein [Leclercia adecarboxylata]|uniref:Response regulatory domain-containing protein n=1 Tax=Leclercia adecarboxylata TaxID=83655 RepID=A0A4U9HM16_9ENTR|nr:Uncharacterised protein [Leclercia adecarboxylata]
MQRYAVDHGAVAFLRKPINVEVLLAHIQRAPHSLTTATNLPTRTINEEQ